MRSLLTIIALFSLWGLRAQSPAPAAGQELPRGNVRVYPTQQEATAADDGNNRYFTRIADWSQQGNVFSAPFTMPFAWANRQVKFHLESASADYEIRVNGQRVAYNSDGNTPAEFNITKYAKEGRNTLEIELTQPSKIAALESWKQSPAPTIGPAWVMSQPTLHIRDILSKTWRNEDDGTTRSQIGIIARSNALNPRTSRIYYELLTPTGETAATGYKDITLDMRREDTVRFLATIPAELLWSPQQPTQYSLRLRTQHQGRYEEYLELPMGFRTLTFRDGRMAINGQPAPLKIREVSPTIADSEITTLREQGFNTLRLLPGAVRPGLYDFCDQQGMYVIAQAPIDTRNSGESRRKGGNPSNDPAWKDTYIERAANSYHTSKRHPSVIAFALATKSSNGICLYETYLAMKRLDEVRPFIYPDAAGEWNTDQLALE